MGKMSQIAGGVLAFVDHWMDVTTGVLFLGDDHKWWAALTFLIVGISTVVSFGAVINESDAHCTTGGWKAAVASPLGLLPLVMVLSPVPGADEDLYQDLKVWESILETGPQTLLHTYILVALRYGQSNADERVTGFTAVYLVISIVRSIASTVWPYVSAFREAYEWSVLQTVNYGIVSTALATAALFANFRVWALLPILLYVFVVLVGRILALARDRGWRNIPWGKATIGWSVNCHMGNVFGISSLFSVSADTVDEFDKLLIRALQVPYLVLLSVLALVIDKDVHGICSDEQEFNAGGCWDYPLVVTLISFTSLTVILVTVWVVTSWYRERTARLPRRTLASTIIAVAPSPPTRRYR